MKQYFVKIEEKLEGEDLPIRYVEVEDWDEATAFIRKDVYQTLAEEFEVDIKNFEDVRDYEDEVSGYADEYGILIGTSLYDGHKKNIFNAHGFIDWADGYNLKLYYMVSVETEE